MFLGGNRFSLKHLRTRLTEPEGNNKAATDRLNAELKLVFYASLLLTML